MSDKEYVLKIRRCTDTRYCPYKNVWWDATQCLAKFHIWHTCTKKSNEEKIKKVEKHGFENVPVL